MSPEPPSLSRRTIGAGAVAAALATVLVGCDSDEPLDLPGLPPLGEEEPDLDRVRAGLLDERRLLDQVAAASRRHRRLRRVLAPTAAVHEAHVRLLSRAVEGGAGGEEASTAPRQDGSPRPRVAADPTQAVAQLVRAERSLAESHVGTAMRSRSGALARVLASMSAAAAQQAALLAPLAEREGEGP